MKNWKHVYVVYRLDIQPNISLDFAVTIKSVHTSESEADSEVARLNALNNDKGCRYSAQIAKMGVDESLA